ncbi:MAG: N-formylglutamate amidohydrolase, partial [Sphaerochaetaceae bacterium]|nr:N-formylglutamate amidohydrolase [Sphaerochaetaceae bacterium]
VQTPESLISLLHEYFTGNGYTVALNEPYAGTYIPRIYSYQAKKTDLARSSAMKVQSIMIEVNRSLYMDEATGEKHDGFIRVQNHLRRLWPLLKNNIAGTCEGS